VKKLLLALSVFVFVVGCEHQITRVDNTINVTIVAKEHPDATYTVQHYSFGDNTGALGFMWNWRKFGDLEMQYDTNEVKIVLEGRVTFGVLKEDPAMTINDTLVTDKDTVFIFEIY